MKNPNEPMTKAQRHIILGDRGKRRRNRCQEYGKPAIKKYISDTFDIPYEEVNLQNLTKEQAQAIIVNFKPHKPEEKKPTEDNA